MDRDQRRRYILDRLRERERVDTDELVEAFEVSPMTVRRDLEDLANHGAIRRVRGGAIGAGLRGEGLPFAVRAADGSELKRRLGAAAAAMIADGEAVAVDSGTTGAAAATALAGRRVTAVPLSVQSLHALLGPLSPGGPAPFPGPTAVIVPGGEVDVGEGTFTGPIAERTFAALRLDTAILSCCGAGVRAGVMAYSVREAAVKQAAHRCASRTILIAESEKFSRTALALVCALSDIDALVTDGAVPAEVRAFCRERDVAVVEV